VLAIPQGVSATRETLVLSVGSRYYLVCLGRSHHWEEFVQFMQSKEKKKAESFAPASMVIKLGGAALGLAYLS